MSALTIRLPDDKYERLKALSKRRGTSVNRLIDEMATLLLAEFDAEARFALRAGRGQGRAARGQELLTKAKGVSSRDAGPSRATPGARS
jgi:predicted DNA-binding protein